MSETQFNLLKADIQANGQREHIIVWHGLLVDGRNRLRACEELGIEPEIGELLEETDPVQYALSQNLHRRHLTTAQRSIVAAKLATLKHGQHSDDTSNDVSQDDAAKLLTVSVKSLQRAKHVLENGSTQLAAAVESGDVPVSLAEKLLKTGCNKADQKKLVTEGAKAIREFITAKSPPKQKHERPAIESDVIAELNPDSVVENKDAIKSILGAKSPLVAISTALMKMSQENITAIMLRCEELLEKAAA